MDGARIWATVDVRVTLIGWGYSWWRDAWWLGWTSGRFVRSLFVDSAPHADPIPENVRRGRRVGYFTLAALISVSLLLFVTDAAQRLNNGPSILAAGLVLTWLAWRGPLASLPKFLRKLAKLVASTLLYAALLALLRWDVIWTILGSFGFTRDKTGFHLLLATMLIWIACQFWIVFSRSDLHSAEPTK